MKYTILLITTILFLGCSFNNKDTPQSWGITDETKLSSIDGLYENRDDGNTIEHSSNITAERFVNDNRNATEFDKIDLENSKASLNNFLGAYEDDANASSVKYVRLKLDNKKLEATLFDNDFNILKTVKKNVTVSENKKLVSISHTQTMIGGENVLVAGGGKDATMFLSDEKYIYVKDGSFAAALMILPLPMPIVVSGNDWYRFKKIERETYK